MASLIEEKGKSILYVARKAASLGLSENPQSFDDYETKLIKTFVMEGAEKLMEDLVDQTIYGRGPAINIVTRTYPCVTYGEAATLHQQEMKRWRKENRVKESLK